jgi:hypothetical protein
VSGIGNPSAVFLLGYRFIEPGLQLTPYRGHGVLRVEAPDGHFI